MAYKNIKTINNNIYSFFSDFNEEFLENLPLDKMKNSFFSIFNKRKIFLKNY